MSELWTYVLYTVCCVRFVSHGYERQLPREIKMKNKIYYKVENLWRERRKKQRSYIEFVIESLTRRSMRLYNSESGRFIRCDSLSEIASHLERINQMCAHCAYTHSHTLDLHIYAFNVRLV